LNIWNRQGPWEARARLIRRELEALAPDVVGLQEVLRLEGPGDAASGSAAGSDQAKELGQGLGYHVAYASAWEIGWGLHFGNALLSRYPIVETRASLLPHLDSGETRSLLYALVEHPKAQVPVFVTHLNWKFHHGYVRVRQVAYIAEQVMALAPVETSFPPILMGDFNAPPDADEIRFLRGLHVLDGKSVFFNDAWTYAGPGGPGYTFDRANGFTLMNREESRRIDYLFVRGPDKHGRAQPTDTRLAFTACEGEGDARIWPSDHFGLVCDFTVG